MKKARVVSAIVMSVLLLGALVVSGEAKKPPSPPGLEPTIVTLSGAIEGTGEFANIAITLSDEFQGYGYDIYHDEYFREGGSFIANTDYPPALSVSGTPNNKNLSYYYCDYKGKKHITNNGICADESHDPDNYKRLRLLGGAVDKQTRDIVWPAGSEWRIGWKLYQDDGGGGLFIVGTLSQEVRYTVED